MSHHKELTNLVTGSALAAAETACEAIDRGDTSARGSVTSSTCWWSNCCVARRCQLRWRLGGCSNVVRSTSRIISDIRTVTMSAVVVTRRRAEEASASISSSAALLAISSSSAVASVTFVRCSIPACSSAGLSRLWQSRARRRSQLEWFS